MTFKLERHRPKKSTGIHAKIGGRWLLYRDYATEQAAKKGLRKLLKRMEENGR